MYRINMKNKSFHKVLDINKKKLTMHTGHK